MVTRLKKMLINAAILVGVLYALLLIFMYVSQRSLLYFPSPAYETTKQTRMFEREGFVLNGYVINPGQTDALIYFGGNAEAVIANAGWFHEHLPELTVYLMDYRGYGHSEGEPSEQALLGDALHVYDIISKEHQNLSAMGRSLGSGVANYLAAHRKIDKLTLITPYDSIVDVAQGHYPIVPVGWLLKDHYPSWQWAPSVKAEVLVIIAGQDRVVPPAHAERLITHFSGKVSKVILPDATHNDIFSWPNNQAAIKDFLAR